MPNPVHEQKFKEVEAILAASLTGRGITQWWDARNRYLKGERPRRVFAEGRLDEVVEAATAFADGAYL